MTHIGTFICAMIPFGLKPAPNTFQVIMTRVLKDCGGSLVPLDDILIVGKIPEELRIRRERVERVLKDERFDKRGQVGQRSQPN